MPETIEAEEVHFVDGLLRGPAIMSDAVGGYKDAGAILAEMTVHENFSLRMITKNDEKPGHLSVGGRRPAVNGNIHELNAERFGLLALPCNLPGIFATQIDDRGDSQLFQLREAVLPRLCAAVKDIVNFAGVRYSREPELFSSRGTDAWRGGGRGGGLCGRRKRNSAKGQKQCSGS